MAMKSEPATIDFLLTCLDSVEGKVNWEAVAVKTGWYKSGKFSKQAFSNIHKKYAGTVIGAAESEAPTTPAKAKRTTTKKRPAVDGGESINGDVKSSKKGGASGGRQNKKIKADEGDSDADGDATSNNDDGDALKTEE